MAAIAAAMSKAGYKTPEDQLDTIAREAWTKWSDSKSANLRREYVASKLRDDLTWSLLEQTQPQVLQMAIGWLLNHVRWEIEASQPQRRPYSGGQRTIETHGRGASASYGEPDREVKSELTAPRPGVAEAKRAVAHYLSKLDTVRINGRSIRHVTAGEARSWARKHGTEAIFISLLVSNMPDEWIVGAHWRDKEADEMYARAQASYAG